MKTQSAQGKNGNLQVSSSKGQANTTEVSSTAKVANTTDVADITEATQQAQAQDQDQSQDQSQDQKQYIGDVGQPLKGAAQKTNAGVGMISFAVLIGFVIGLIVWAVLWASTFLTGLLWKDAKGFLESTLSANGLPFWWLPIAFCTIGGLFIGLWTKYTKSSPESLEKVMASVKENGGYTLKRPLASIVAFLLPLVFGGSIGPEAGLTGIIAAACTRIGNMLKGAGLRIKSVTDLTISAALSAVFAAPVAGIVACAQDGMPESKNLKNYEFRTGVKLVIYTAAALGAAAGITVFSSIFGSGLGLPRFDGTSAGILELSWAVPCFVLGYIGALLYHCANSGFGFLSKKLQKYIVLKAVIAGVLLGICGIFLPYVLFPGEEQAFELMEDWQKMAGALLIATGLLKCIATPMCLHFGWRGGNFFPCIFAGIAAGYGMAAISGADPMFCVCITTASLVAAIQRKPFMALGLLLLCFPAESLVWMGLACIAGAYAPMPKKILQK